MAALLFVRIKFYVDRAEVDRRLHEREPRFQEVPGLLQKIYGGGPTTGDVCGVKR